MVQGYGLGRHAVGIPCDDTSLIFFGKSQQAAYQCQKPLVNRKHAVTDAHSHYSWSHIVAASAGIYFSGQIDSQMGNQILFKI